MAGEREDAQKVEIHRVVGDAEHAGEAGLGDLHEVAGRFVDGHRLAGDAVGAEDEPLTVGGPLVVRLVDLGITRGLGGEKRERDAGDFVDHDFFLRREACADLGGDGRENEEKGESEKGGRAGVGHGGLSGGANKRCKASGIGRSEGAGAGRTRVGPENSRVRRGAGA